MTLNINTSVVVSADWKRKPFAKKCRNVMIKNNTTIKPQNKSND